VIGPQGFVLREHAPGWSPEEIQALTEAKLVIADDLKAFRLRD
jgi:acyl CoA:acetate/3-ketoacid CoA transferase beta subunit